MADEQRTEDAADLPPLSVLRLRRLAEKASGLRGHPLVMARSTAGGGQWDLMAPEVAEKSPPPYIPIEAQQQTSAGADQWGTMDSVIVTFGKDRHKQQRNLVDEKCDAAFWSPAAIEKFVLGYYLPLLEPTPWLALYLRIKGMTSGPKIYGVIHTYPSVEGLLTDERTLFAVDDDLQTESVFFAETLSLFERSSLGEAWHKLF